MTKDNNNFNWLVLDCGTEQDENGKVVIITQAENIARAQAENYANDNPGHIVGVYQRVAIVQTEPVAKWR